LNCLPARIISAAEASGCEAQINVVAALGEAGRGDRVVARITRKSRDALGLAPGNRVFVQIKSVALLASGPDGMPTDAR
jgi:molybdate transport system ATP-binding protein